MYIMCGTYMHCVYSSDCGKELMSQRSSGYNDKFIYFTAPSIFVLWMMLHVLDNHSLWMLV